MACPPPQFQRHPSLPEALAYEESIEAVLAPLGHPVRPGLTANGIVAHIVNPEALKYLTPGAAADFCAFQDIVEWHAFVNEVQSLLSQGANVPSILHNRLQTR